MMTLKTQFNLAAALTVATVLVASAEEPQNAIKSAISKAKEAATYNYTVKTEMDGPWTPPEVKGTASKDGWLMVTSEREGETTVAVVKDGAGVVKTDEGWKNSSELGRPQGGDRRGFSSRMLLRARPGLSDAEEWAKAAKSLKDVDGTLVSELTEEDAKELANPFRGRGGRGGPGGQGGGDRQPPQLQNAKGKVTFELKEGQLAKASLSTEGDMSFGGEDRHFARTMIITFSEIGTAKLDIPEEAKKAAEAAPKSDVRPPRGPRPEGGDAPKPEAPKPEEKKS